MFADRYDAHVLRPPAEVRNAVRYVLGNFESHAARRGEPRSTKGWVDPFSSAARRGPRQAQLALFEDPATKEEPEARGVDLHGHPYSGLFDRIHEATRRSIAASFSAVSGRQVNDAEFRRILEEDLGDKPFVSWRYVYEKRETHHIDPVLLDQVVIALGKAAERERRRVTGTPG